MSIGTTIKKLRRDRNITQERLAEMMGVSTNAVSQWECEKTAPDISHLPILANIFEVSADILLEIDLSKSKKQDEINEFVAKYSEFFSQGKTEKRLKLCREMQKKYPNDETVRYNLMRALQNVHIDESFDEIVMIGEQLLESSNVEYKMGAIRGLCFAYLHKGDRVKAKQYADMFPPNEDLLRHVLRGEELVKHCQDYFWSVCGKFYQYAKYLVECKEARYTHEEKHSILNSVYDIFHIVFSDKDFGYWNERLSKVCFLMALESGKAGQFERAIKELEKMLAHLEDYNRFGEVIHSSLLVNKIKINQSEIYKSSEETPAHASLRYLNNNDAVFTSIKDDCRYTSIKARLAML